MRLCINKRCRESFTMPDPEVRFALLKVAEIIASSTSEPLPGNLITLSTPTVETPAASQPPKIRISVSSPEIVPDSQGMDDVHLIEK